VKEPLFNPKAQAEDFVQLSESRVVLPTNEIEEEAVKQMALNELKPRCSSMAYNLNASSEAKRIPEDAVSLAYGSASMQGYLFQDRVCIDPLGNRCNPKFQFLALFQSDGLDKGIDGILGLSNHHDKSKKGLNFVQSLKDSGVISKACVSFSVAPNNSYALFGDWNSSQVIGELHSLKTYSYLPEFVGAAKNWALEGQNLLYGDMNLNGILD
jgi:hypothetical protein